MSAAEFRRGITAWVAHTHDLKRDIFVDVTTEVGRSIRIGSPITGAPGQPVQRGTLRASWIEEFLDLFRWQSTTNLPYALGIELGIGPHGPLTLRSAVGGFFSVAKTRAGFQAIVDYCVRRRTGGRGVE